MENSTYLQVSMIIHDMQEASVTEIPSLMSRNKGSRPLVNMGRVMFSFDTWATFSDFCDLLHNALEAHNLDTVKEPSND